MIFLEKKTDQGFNYEVQDVFGKMSIDSTIKLAGDLLDDLVVLIMKQGPGAETVNGEVKHDKGVVSYTFKRAPKWEDDDEPCENSPTSTKEPANVFTAIVRWMRNVWSWYKRFVVAFREAWRNGNNPQG